MNNLIEVTVKPRSSNFIKMGDLLVHPFQKEALNVINNLLKSEEFGILTIDAPVGAGKSFLMRYLAQMLRGYPLILTYPTKILLETQVSSLSNELRNAGFDVATNWQEFRINKINIFKYSTDEIVKLSLDTPNVLNMARGKIIERGLTRSLSNVRFPVMVTTPDVLHMLYNVSAYRGYSKRLVDYLTKAIVIFDEFHTYANLENFYLLIEKLSNYVKFVILLSATPFFEERGLKSIEASYDIYNISFDECERRYTSEAVGRREFNKQLQVYVHEVSSFSESAEHFEPILQSLQDPGPHVVIYNSIFRLRHHTYLIKKYGGVEWSGMVKEDYTNQKIIFGTSSIEVGVHLPFKTLITEVDNWISAIQRIGRVGRFNPGKVHLITKNHDLLVSLENGSCYERSEFEEILKENLPEPKQDWVSGDLFRGESFDFIIYDKTLGAVYTYNESIFSMYRIDDASSINDESDFDELLDDLTYSAGLHGEMIRYLRVRDHVRPFFGILKGRLRKTYTSIDYQTDKSDCVVRITFTKPQLLSFSRSVC